MCSKLWFHNTVHNRVPKLMEVNVIHLILELRSFEFLALDVYAFNSVFTVHKNKIQI